MDRKKTESILQFSRGPVFTIGHSNSSQQQILHLLRVNEIDLLVDVRSSPYSRFASQFNKSVIDSFLKKEGIAYQFLGDYLGGRPTDPTCYKGGTVPQGHADYLSLVDYPAVMSKPFFLEGIQKLATLAQSNRVCLMCSEEDPAQCHRHHLIGRFLADQGVAVLHIRHDGNRIKDQHLPVLADDSNLEQLGLF